MIPIDVLIRPITSDDIFEKALDMLEAVDVPARSWRDGGVAKTLLGVLAELAAGGAVVITDLVKGFFLAYAENDYLTVHAKDVYDVDRITATFATGHVTLSNAGGAVYTVGADEMIVRSSNTSARYRVTQAFVIPAATGAGLSLVPGTVTVSVAAIETGSKSSVSPAEVDELETPLARVTVTNAASIVGTDAEGDDALRKRCKLKMGTWSPFGPRDAYEYAALSAKLGDGTSTSITRVAVSRFSSIGKVKVICATPNGAPSTAELDAVIAECNRIARPDSVTLEVVGAVEHATVQTVTVWANGGSASLIKNKAENALRAFYAAYPIGGISKTDGGTGYVYLDAIAAAIISSSPEAFDVDFEAGVTDIALAPNEVATNTTLFVTRIR